MREQQEDTGPWRMLGPVSGYYFPALEVAPGDTRKIVLLGDKHESIVTKCGAIQSSKTNLSAH